MSTLQLTVTPAVALIDVERRILVEHARPGEQVEIVTRTLRGGQVPWESRATFIADANGQVDLTRACPVAGAYDKTDAMGLLWSQTPLVKGKRELFADNIVDGLTTEVKASTQSGETATASLIQQLATEGVTRREVREDGLVGTLYLPATPGPHPAVMILNGSGGGINEPRAALYASHGFAAFALAYFKAPGLSDYISNTPLEYFKKGMDWLRKTVKPAHDFVALSGQSRGGELVLLLGSIYPHDVSAVAAYVPGAVVHCAQNAADPKIGRNGPAWLFNGQPVTHVWENNRHATWKPFDEGPEPHRHELAIMTALQDHDAVERARILVEKIQGPVICLSGTDDGSWPSSLYSKMITDRLNEKHHPYPVEWLDFEGAGHSILFPYVPTTQHVYAHPVSGRISTTGGRTDLNAQADELSWRGVLKFMQNAVVARAGQTQSDSRTKHG